MNVQEPITNPTLMEAIRAMRANENQKTINAMVNEVMNARFLAPVMMEGEETFDESGTMTLKKDTKMSFYTLQTQQKERYLMAFTDWEQLHLWKQGENIKAVVMGFDDYAALILQEGSALAGFVINGFRENIPFPSALVRSLKEQKEIMEKGHCEHVMGAGETIKLGEPKEYPHAMIEALIAHMEKQEAIHAAYLRLMMRGKETSWLVAVDHDGDRKTVFAGIAEAARPYLNGMFIDFIEPDALGQDTFQDVEPFYQDTYHQEAQSNSIAVIEDIFALKEQGCILGCYLKQGSFQVGDEVEVLDGKGQPIFSCVLEGMETSHGRVEQVMAKDGEARAGIMILSRDKASFLPGYCLRKKQNHGKLS